MCKKILYGADKTGLLALKYFGKENIAFFCDGSFEKIGKRFHGILCISPDDLIKIKDEVEIIICSSHYKDILNNLVKNGIYRIQSIGSILVDSIISDQDKFYLFTLYQIGDTVTICSLAKHLKELKNIQHLVLVCKESHKDIALMFDAFDECVTINDEETRLIKLCNINYERVYGSNFIIGNYNLLLKIKWYFNNRIDFFRTCILQLPPQYMPCKVSKNFLLDTKTFFRNETDNVVIVAPYALTLKMLPVCFWEELVQDINSMGYKVYTNVAKNEKEIYGSERLELSLRETFSLGEKIKCLISYRSGFSDFMACNINLNHIVINPNDGYMSKRDVSAYGSKKIINLDWSNKSEEMISKIIELLKNKIYQKPSINLRINI